jgi:hypothetical protein
LETNKLFAATQLKQFKLRVAAHHQSRKLQSVLIYFLRITSLLEDIVATLLEVKMESPLKKLVDKQPMMIIGLRGVKTNFFLFAQQPDAHS